jgi:hypothetical protein
MLAVLSKRVCAAADVVLDDSIQISRVCLPVVVRYVDSYVKVLPENGGQHLETFDEELLPRRR